ncbi:ImmA/IrrE family metallo-endopeptidase [Glutamicibacter ectropisis]|uniref:ImmA/IrrE family metallo-endopeptidase n=1 Tax=Glutamicibacter ectropisis TaxID=3046593 RepID=A0AAU6WIW3_9MICC
MQNVWGKLRELAHTVVVWTKPPSSGLAGTDGQHIWIDPSLSSTEKRCVLAHEIFHLVAGHTTCQPPTVERQLRLEVARFLIPYEDLRRVAGWATCPAEMAEELNVIEQVVLDRLATLDGDQLQELWPPSEHIA